MVSDFRLESLLPFHSRRGPVLILSRDSEGFWAGSLVVDGRPVMADASKSRTEVMESLAAYLDTLAL